MNFLLARSRLLPLLVLLFLACGYGYVAVMDISYGIAIIVLGLVILFVTIDIRMFIYLLIAFLSVVGLFSDYLKSIEFATGTAFRFNALGLLNIGITTIGLGYFAIKHKEIHFKRIKVSRLLILYLGFSLLTIPFSINLREALSRWITIATPIMVFFMVQNSVKTHKKAKKIIKFIAIMGTILIGFSFYQMLTGKGMRYYEALDSYRLTGLGMEPNPYAMYLTFLFCVALLQYIFARGMNRVPWAIYTLTLLVLIVFTYTRIAWVAVIACITILLFVQKRWFSLIAALGIVILLLFTPFVQSRVGHFTEYVKILPQIGKGSAIPAGPLNSLITRTYMWYLTMKNLVLKNGMTFLIGNGVGSTFAWGKSHPDILFNWAPHNEYIVILGDTGVVGLLIFLSVFISMIKLFVRRYYLSDDPFQKSLSLSSVLLIISFLLFCLTDNILGYWSIAIFYWLVIGLAVAGDEVDRRSVGSFQVRK